MNDCRSAGFQPLKGYFRVLFSQETVACNSDVGCFCCSATNGNHPCETPRAVSSLAMGFLRDRSPNWRSEAASPRICRACFRRRPSFQVGHSFEMPSPWKAERFLQHGRSLRLSRPSFGDGGPNPHSQAPSSRRLDPDDRSDETGDSLLGGLRYSWRLNRFLELNKLSEAEYQWLRHGRRRNEAVPPKGASR